jgi:FkbM family methyltransferase
MPRIATDVHAPPNALRRLPPTLRIVKRYQRNARLLAPHVAGRRDQAALRWFCVKLAVAGGLLQRPAPEVVVRLRSGPEITLTDSSELIGMREVFVEEQYRLNLPHPPKTILDCGANVGFASAYFAQRYPDASIYAVEADPRTFTKLERLADQLPNVHPVHRAITGEDGPVTFHSLPRSMGSSLFARGGEGEVVEVPGSTLATLLDELGIELLDLLKLDVEGAEFAVLDAARSVLPRVEAIAAEIHFDLAESSDASLRAVLDGFQIDLEPLSAPGRSLLLAGRAQPLR